MPNQSARFPTLVTYRSAEALRNDGIRYAYLKFTQFIGFTLALAMLCLGIAIDSIWPLGISIVAMGVALFCGNKAEYPSFVRLSVAEMDLMAQEMGLPPAVIKQTQNSVLLGLPEEISAMSTSAAHSKPTTPSLLIPFPASDLQADGVTDESNSNSHRDSQPTATNIAELNVERLKTPEEFQIEYLLAYEHDKKKIIPLVFGIPAFCVAGAIGWQAYFVPEFEFDGFTLLLATIGYLLVSAGSYFALIRCLKPRTDEGSITRNILKSSARYRK